MNIFIPSFAQKASMQTKRKDVPVGIIRPQGESLDNVELRVTLQKAVDDADLNVSERMALNKKFFPNGGGVPLCKKGAKEVYITTFHKPGKTLSDDEFAKECDAIDDKLPENVDIWEKFSKSKKGNYKTNLDNALKKLKQTLKVK